MPIYASGSKRNVAHLFPARRTPQTKSPWPHRSTSSAVLSHPSHHTLSGPRVSLPLPPLYIIIDIGNPPSGTLTPFNIYVVLSRARGRNQIGLLRDFDDKLLTKHPSEYLCLEDERLGDLETKTDEWWQQILSELSE